MEIWDDSYFREPSGVNSGFWTIRADYGGFHVYAFTMTMGVVVAIACAAYLFWKKGLKIEKLMMGAILAVPAGLFGGSFFGKLGNGGSFWSWFAFWEAGMSIHGAILFGAISGIAVFYVIGRKERVSVLIYMDFILPNILLSQAIGRWGNFFNHEIFGKPAGLYSEGALNWLPNFIRTNMTFQYFGASGQVINGITLQNGELYVMHPIFLYESISFILLWALVMFLVPLIKYLTKKVPWKINPIAFPIRSKALKLDQLIGSSEEELKNYKKIIKYDENKQPTGTLYYLSKRYIWKTAYYKNIDTDSVKNYQNNIQIIEKNRTNAINGLETKPFRKFFQKICINTKAKWNVGRELNKANNPQNYNVVKAGVQAGGYFFTWNLVRLILETQRPINNLFIKNDQVLSVILVALTALFGIALIVISQWVTPYLFRKPGFIYEKEFFYTEDEAKASAISTRKKVKDVSEKTKKQKLREQKAKEKLDKILNEKNS